MKCRKNNNALISVNACLKRQELLNRMDISTLHLLGFTVFNLKKCNNCKQGKIVKKHPFKRFDKDLKEILNKKTGNKYKEIEELGIIQEINRVYLHPIGFHIVLKEDGEMKIIRTENPAGFFYKELDYEKIKRFKGFYTKKSMVRNKAVKFIIQNGENHG